MADNVVWMNSISLMWSAWRRREVSDAAFKVGLDALYAVVRERDAGRLVGAAFDARVIEILSEAKASPPAPKVLPPLPTAEVDVAEVMAVLRRVLAGEAEMRPAYPWSDVWHGIGTFEVDGWSMTGFKRDWGMKYLNEVTAPDGRRSTWESFEAREGNPFSLLSEDEQDAFCKMLEGE